MEIVDWSVSSFLITEFSAWLILAMALCAGCHFLFSMASRHKLIALGLGAVASATLLIAVAPSDIGSEFVEGPLFAATVTFGL